MRIQSGVQEVIAPHRIAVFRLHSAALVGLFIGLANSAAQHAPAAAGGILPSFLTSMWTRSPQAADSIRRITRPVGRSSQRSLARPYRVSTRCTVEGCNPSR